MNHALAKGNLMRLRDALYQKGHQLNIIHKFYFVKQPTKSLIHSPLLWGKVAMEKLAIINQYIWACFN